MSFDALLKIDGIDGESLVDKHADEIDVLNFSWNMSQSGTTHVGGGGGAGKVSVSDLMITKYVDKASPNLYLACCNGRHIPKVTFTIRKAGEKALDYYIIEMEEVLITNVSPTGSAGKNGDDRPVETASLNFAKYKASYQPQGKDGAASGGAIEAEYNVAEDA